jgi:sec-independent protein translocase protein TatC
LLIAAGTVIAIFICLVPFANGLFHYLATPLLARLPNGSSMIATEVTSPFLTPFKFALIVAVFLAVPVILYQAWAFIAPGLYRHERRMVMPLLGSSTVLFYGGCAFAYYVVFPMMFAFFTAAAPKGVAVMTDIRSYLDFVLAIFLAFGAAFEIPVATVLIVWTGFLTPDKLAKYRPYVLIGVFVVGMLISPPDVVSQSLLAIPMYGLYELGILLSRIMVPGAKQREAGGH